MEIIQHIRITYNTDLSLKLIHRAHWLWVTTDGGRLDLKSLRLPKFQKSFPLTYQTRFLGSPQIFEQVFTWVPITQKSVRENWKNLDFQISKYSSVISSGSIHVDLSLTVNDRDALSMRHSSGHSHLECVIHASFMRHSSGHSHLEWLVYPYIHMHLHSTWLCVECRRIRDTFNMLCPASSFMVTRLHFYWPVPTHLSFFLRLIHDLSYVILVATTGAISPSIPRASCVTRHIVGYMSMCDSSFVWLQCQLLEADTQVATCATGLGDCWVLTHWWWQLMERTLQHMLQHALQQSWHIDGDSWWNRVGCHDVLHVWHDSSLSCDMTHLWYYLMEQSRIPNYTRRFGSGLQPTLQHTHCNTHTLCHTTIHTLQHT